MNSDLQGRLVRLDQDFFKSKQYFYFPSILLFLNSSESDSIISSSSSDFPMRMTILENGSPSSVKPS